MVPTDNTTLTVINKFGSVVTETWAENNIVIDVTVKVEHSSAEKAKKLLDMITVKFTETGGNLTAETVFNDDFSSINWKGGPTTTSASTITSKCRPISTLMLPTSMATRSLMRYPD